MKIKYKLMLPAIQLVVLIVLMSIGNAATAALTESGISVWDSTPTAKAVSYAINFPAFAVAAVISTALPVLFTFTYVVMAVVLWAYVGHEVDSRASVSSLKPGGRNRWALLTLLIVLIVVTLTAALSIQRVPAVGIAGLLWAAFFLFAVITHFRWFKGENPSPGAPRSRRVVRR